MSSHSPGSVCQVDTRLTVRPVWTSNCFPRFGRYRTSSWSRTTSPPRCSYRCGAKAFAESDLRRCTTVTAWASLASCPVMSRLQDSLLVPLRSLYSGGVETTPFHLRARVSRSLTEAVLGPEGGRAPSPYEKGRDVFPPRT